MDQDLPTDIREQFMHFVLVTEFVILKRELSTQTCKETRRPTTAKRETERHEKYKLRITDNADQLRKTNMIITTINKSHARLT
jgi:hypothetical protein